MQTRREKMWGIYHTIRSSTSFKDVWTKFLKDIVKTDAIPILFQLITDKVFHKEVRSHFPVSERQPTIEGSMTFTFEEENAIRYIAGYIHQNISKKIMSSSRTNKEEIQHALNDFLKEKEATSVQASTSSTDWLEMLDRGKLTYVNNAAHNAFCCIELKIRSHLRISKVKCISEGTRQKMMDDIINCEDVQLCWSLISSDMSDEIGHELLMIAVEIWIKVRGFSFAKAYMELYKQQNKKSLQKSKSLRKALK